MRLIRKIFRIFLIALWLAFTGIVVFFVHFGFWNAVGRVTFFTRIWGAVLARILGVRIHVCAMRRITGGLIVSNHLGYLDILVHAALFRVRFAPKAEIQRWPVLGPYLAMSRPVWVDRSSRIAAAKCEQEFEQTLRNRINLIVYPEGTSTDGRHGLLPFKSTVFESARRAGAAVYPILTFYRPSEDGSPTAWFGDAKALPHLWNLLGRRRIDADVYCLEPITPRPDESRKELTGRVENAMNEAYRQITGAAED